jgi:uncharacterized protein
MSSFLSRAGWLRVAPFVLFMVLLAARGAVPADGSWGFDPRWLYAVQTVMVGALLVFLWREYGELSRPQWPSAGQVLLAVVVGVAVFGLWIVLDQPWMMLGEATRVSCPRTPRARSTG